MKKGKLLAGAVIAAIGGLAMTSITSATAPVTVESNGDITVCGTEYVSDSNGSGGCITIQGKNVGATTIWGGPGAPSTSYGNYYQWGDNTPRTKSNWNSNNIQPDNARGGGSDNNELIYPVENADERRGPCDEGYHVPSQGEWYAFMDMWAGSSTNGKLLDNVSQFYTDFQIPFAGYRDLYDARLSNIQATYLWTSSPNAGNATDARYMYVDANAANLNNHLYRSLGYPVRCFKDSALGSSSSEGGEPQVIVNIAEFNGGQNTCTGSNYIFENITAGTNTGTYTRSGVFECSFGNGRSSSIIQLQLSGNLVASGDRVLSGTNVKMINSEWTSQPLGLKFASTLLETYQALTTTQVLFRKSADLIGVASGVVTIKLTVPGGTPDGTYNGTLVLTY